MKIETMDREELKNTLTKAMELANEQQKLIELRDQRNKYLKPEFEKTPAGQDAKKARADALAQPQVKTMRDQLKRADQRMELATHPVAIKKNFNRNTIVVVAVLLVIAVIAIVGRVVMGGATGETNAIINRVMTLTYTLTILFAFSFAVYRIVFWKKYQPQLVNYAQGKIDELKPIAAKFKEAQRVVNDRYNDAIQPFLATFNSDDEKYLRIQQSLEQQQVVVADSQTARNLIPEEFNQDQLIQRFIKLLTAGTVNNWEQAVKIYRDQQAQKIVKKQAEQAQQLAAQAKKTRRRNQGHLQQHHSSNIKHSDE